MSHTQVLVSGIRPTVLAETTKPLPQFSQLPSRNIYFWRFFIVLLMFPAVLFAWPRQSALEYNLSPDNILAIVNHDRENLGLNPLRMNARLSRAAYAKAEHMLRNAYFAHTSPNGIEPWDFIKEQSFKYSFAGENLAMNYTSSYELENDLLHSPSHRDNLLSPVYSEMGIAVVEGELDGQTAVLTVQMFGSPAPDQLGMW